MKVIFLDTVHEALESGLVEAGFECLDWTKKNLDSIHESISEAEGIVIRSRIPMDESFLSKASNLKFIARSGAGMENIDLDYCSKKSIEVFAAPEGNRNAVAEHALGMLLSLFNNIHSANTEVRQGIWNREGNRGVELDGKTVGIIGFGNNGSAFAKKLAGFDVEILAFDKYKTGFGGDSVSEVGLEELMEKADVISLHIPQNNETIGMIDSHFISAVQRPFYLINLSRGKIVKTADLMQGIDDGKILGACLDVLEYEKSSFENMFADNEITALFKDLLSSKKVLLTPHVGGWTAESYRLLSEVLLSKILAKFGVDKA